MKIILTSVGTRGDMEPFLAIGEMLKEKGHQVICAFPEQFSKLAEDLDLEFASLGQKYIELLESDTGKAAMGGSSGIRKLFAYIKLASEQTAANKEYVNKQYEIIERQNPDRIIYNSKSVYPIIWELNNIGKTTIVSVVPFMHYVEGHSHIVFSGKTFGKVINKSSFSLADFGLVTTTMISKKWLKLPEKINRKQIRNVFHNRKSVYTISPSLFPRPNYWDENIKVLGYYEKKKTGFRLLDKTLTNFIEKHNKILFITFGSMINPDPKGKTRIILDILERNKIPAIINTASGGLIKPDKYDSEQVYFVSQIPYDLIFPKMYGVIHHGGSGTTHLALKYGCASMIIPHVIDQFVWNNIIHEKGAGPKGIKISKISTKEFELKIIGLVNNKSFKKRAEQIALEMKQEDFKNELYKTIIE